MVVKMNNKPEASNKKKKSEVGDGGTEGKSRRLEAL
jgi:hypothetical protein